MKIELDIEADEIINDMTPDGLIQALREKFKAQDREIQKYKDRCDEVGGWKAIRIANSVVKKKKKK
jgi:hypothetical protein